MRIQRSFYVTSFMDFILTVSCLTRYTFDNINKTSFIHTLRTNITLNSNSNNMVDSTPHENYKWFNIWFRFLLMSLLVKLRERLLGKSLDTLKPSTRHSIVLVSFLAWIGLGADGYLLLAMVLKKHSWLWALTPIGVSSSRWQQHSRYSLLSIFLGFFLTHALLIS